MLSQNILILIDQLKDRPCAEDLMYINFYCHNATLHESTRPVAQISVGGKNACFAHIRVSPTPYELPGTELAFKNIFLY